MTRLSDGQRAVLDGLAAGRRLVGPVGIVRPMSGRRAAWRERRPWGWADGPASSAGAVHAHSVASLAARGIIVIEEARDRREARLVAPTPDVHPSPCKGEVGRGSTSPPEELRSPSISPFARGRAAASRPHPPEAPYPSPSGEGGPAPDSDVSELGDLDCRTRQQPSSGPVGGDGRASETSTGGPLPPSSGWSPSPVPGEDGAPSGTGLGAG